MLTYDVILAPKMTKFGAFSPKMTYFDKFSPLMTFLTKFMSINLTEIFFRNFLKVSKKYLSRIYGHKFSQKCYYWGEFGQNRSFLVKWSNLGHFGDQNDVIGPHFRVGPKYFFLQTVSKVILVKFIR